MCLEVDQSFLGHDFAKVLAQSWFALGAKMFTAASTDSLLHLSASQQ